MMVSFRQIEINRAFTQPIQFFNDRDMGRVWMVRVQVRLVHEAHDDAVRVSAGIQAVIFAC